MMHEILSLFSPKGLSFALNWLYEILGGMLLICHYTAMQVYGAWIRIYYALCPKRYDTFDGLYWLPAGSRQAARSARICEARLLNSFHVDAQYIYQ